MAKYLLTEDREGKSGYTFWTTLMAELFPEVIVESRQNNRGILKAVKNIDPEDGNEYIIAYDQSFDNDQVIRETKKLFVYAQSKQNVYILNLISFEYILLEFKYLSEWLFAEHDEFRFQRADLFYLLTRNTGFEVAKGCLGICWRSDCCGFFNRQPDDLCGLDQNRLSLHEKMLQILTHTSLHTELRILMQKKGGTMR